MEIELSRKSIDAIARRTAVILAEQMKQREEPELVSTAEAAKILHIQPQRMREIKDRFPHVKQGDKMQGKLLFVRKALLENY